METPYGYGIPMDVLGFFKDGTFPTVTEEDSIARHLHLLLTTCTEEYPPDPSYGCELWDHEFGTVQGTAVWMDRLSQNIAELVKRYEPRLDRVEVKARMDQAEFKLKREGQVAGRLKRRLHIMISGRLTRTDVDFRFENALLLAPFSLD